MPVETSADSPVLENTGTPIVAAGIVPLFRGRRSGAAELWRLADGITAAIFADVCKLLGVRLVGGF